MVAATKQESMLFAEHGIRCWFDVERMSDSVSYTMARAMIWAGQGDRELLTELYNRKNVEVKIVDTIDRVIAGVWDDGEDE